MKIFEPTRLREVACEGMLAFLLENTYDQKRPMGNVAAAELGDVIRSWLIGFHREVAPIVPRSLQWLDKAIADEEDQWFGVDPNTHRTTLHWAKAIGLWLNVEGNHEGEWDLARTYEEARWRYEKRPWPTHEIVKWGLDDYMAFAYLGGQHAEGFEAGIEMYERWTGKSEVSLSKPLKPRDFGYALCLHQTARQAFDEEDLFKAGRKVLQAHLQQTWLGGGQAIRAATWLNIVYGLHDPNLTPLQVVLKAYENMPDVPRPDFVSEV